MEGTRDAIWEDISNSTLNSTEVVNRLSTYVGIDVEGCILHQSLSHVHHLGQDEDILQTVGNLLRNELNEVGDQLVETRVIPETGICGGSVLFACFIQECTADLLEVQLQLLGQNVLDGRFHRHLASATHRSKCGVGVGSLRDQLEVARIGGSGVLRNGRLDTFDGEPVA